RYSRSGFRASGQRFYYRSAADGDAGLRKRVQEVVKQLIQDLLGHRLLSRKPVTCRQLFRDRQADGLRLRFAGAIELIRERHRRLHNAACSAVDVKLTSRKPAEVGGIGGVKQEKRTLTASGYQVDGNGAGRITDLDLESGLLGNAGNSFRVQF